MTEELEDRLRRTYRAVAERTTVGAGERSVELRSDVDGPRDATRWSRLGLVAAAALLLIGGLAVLATTRSESRSSAGSAHVLPTWIPTAPPESDEVSRSRLALTSITTDDAVDVLTYASDSLALTVSVFRTSIDEFDGDRVEVRGGQSATVDGDEASGRLLWDGAEGPTIVVEWTGALSNGLASVIALVDGLILVDESTWNAATEFGGFTENWEIYRRRVGAVSVDLVGDLQSGLQLFVGGNGFSESSIDPGQCVREFGGGEDGVALVAVSRFPTGTATVTWFDGIDETVDLVPFVEGSALGVAVFERDDFDPANLPDVRCEESQ